MQNGGYNKSNLKSFDFAVNIFFMKLLKTSSTDIVKILKISLVLNYRVN